MEVLQGAIDCKPEETGYDSRKLEDLHQHFQRLIDKDVIAGAQYTIAHKGKIIANASIGGGSRVDADVKMKPDTTFKICSITKIFTAVAIFQLVEDGYMRLDNKVGEILPQFNHEPFTDITVWHLLTHTSGLYPDPDCYPEDALVSAWEAIDEGAKHWDGEGEFDWVKAGLSVGLRRPIGSQWMYCSFGFMVLGEIIRKITGQFAHDYIEEHITKPLSMNETTFVPTIDMAKRMFVSGELHKQVLEEMIAGTYKEKETIWNKLPATANGLYSCTRDLIRFGNMLLGNGRLDGVRILGRKTVELTTTPQLHNKPDTCWGSKEPDRQFGIGFDMKQGPAYNYSQGSYFHEGYGACSLDMDPKEQLCVAWYVPWKTDVWNGDALFNVQNIIWSGLI